MQTISYTTVRATLAKTMQEICENHTPTIITRGKSEPVVLLSLADFHAMAETQYLLRSPKNAKRLFESIDEIETMISTKKALKKCK